MSYAQLIMQLKSLMHVRFIFSPLKHPVTLMISIAIYLLQHRRSSVVIPSHHPPRMPNMSASPFAYHISQPRASSPCFRNIYVHNTKIVLKASLQLFHLLLLLSHDV
ncbi:hypothetical protein HBH98_191950 [Parastagonospora nodorum]|nr:hypothetical protein HBH53_113820 [Parastagonospora nodorum]KAH3993894.1 hypothetical protein HBI10_196520 [Parastagonospora nodorum]KAH4012931.1 hypothetical protein HBI13_184770 [Parastagonospora nodorum]KAH4020775.1 hypothetical protein HBI09_179920 [Parastagonospora nodorum]KAH4095367.1 hypothetical protein HBH46_167760 [Parastagonospora nodorum]